MPMDFCPRCRATQNMTVTVSSGTETGPDGTTKQIETWSYSCEQCNSFVRSENRAVLPGCLLGLLLGSGVNKERKGKTTPDRT